METVNFEKKRQFCVHFVSPIKTKSVPERDAFCFATRILPQAFFVQVVCYKCFSYKNFATSVFRTSVFRTSGLPQVFFVQVVCYKCGYTIVYIQEFCKVPSKQKTVFATSVFSHTASFICCKAHVSSFNAMQQYQPKSRQRVSLCKGRIGFGRKCETPLQCKCYDVAQLCFSLWLHYKFVRLLRRFVIDKTVCIFIK